MSVSTGAGTKISIGTTAAHGDQSEYEADTYTEIEQTESIGDFGDSTAEVTFTGLGDARVQKKKGSADAGTLSVTMAFDDALPGQIALIAASEDFSSEDYNFKIEFVSGAINYLSGQVGTAVTSVSGADNIVMLTSDVRVNTPVLRVAAP